MNTQILLKKVSQREIEALQTLCRETYVIYFADHWVDQGLELYLEEQFSRQRLLSDINHKTVDYFFVCFQAQIVGYLKISYRTSFAEFNQETACELEKMYISPEFIGQGIGMNALNTTIDMMRNMGKKTMYLCVLDTNKKGLSFYEKVGFKFQNKTRLKYDHFKEELKGLHVLKINL